MNEPRGGVAERLERLERWDRRLLRTGALVLCGIGVVFAMGQASPARRLLEAQRLVIRDADGKARAVLGVVGDGTGLTLLDLRGAGRATLSLGVDDTARLRLYDRDGRARVSLDVTSGGSSSAGFYDQRGTGRAQLRVAPDGSPEVGFFEKDGSPMGPKMLLPY